MNPRIKVTFVTMAYNVEQYIEKAVRSVLDQTVPEVEIYVRNNGSSDRTGEILERLAAEDSRVHVLTNRVNGVTEDGIKFFERGWWIPDETQAGEYISILDGDDYLEPDFVETLYRTARENGADITAAGSYTFSKNGVEGVQAPEPIITDSLKDIEPIYMSIYDCFRTWWGKLYKTEFFFAEYDYAWGCHPPMHWLMDTIIMSRYLRKCRKLVTIAKPLYNMYIRSDSTYKTRVVNYGILWAANALYDNNMSFITENNIATLQNKMSVDLLHWEYLIDGIRPFHKNTRISPEEKLRFIRQILNDSIVGQYSSKLFVQIYGGLTPILSEIEEQAEDASIYAHYIMRLKCFVDSLKADETNPLNYPLLLGVLFDPLNRNWIGMKFMENPLPGASLGIRRDMWRGEAAWKCWSEEPSVFVNEFCRVNDGTPEVRKAEEDLARYWAEGRYQECYLLVDAVSRAANLSREAMYYRIKLMEHFGEHTSAVILAYTARILFNRDAEMSELCQRVIGGGEDGE